MRLGGPGAPLSPPPALADRERYTHVTGPMKRITTRLRGATSRQIIAHMLSIVAGGIVFFGLIIWLGYHHWSHATAQSGQIGTLAALAGSMLALAALLAGIAGISRVVHGLTRRLAALREHMLALAAGDTTLRMDREREDEVGRLESAFDDLAIALARAQGKVADQSERLQSSQADMHRLEKAKDDFLVLVSHEVRTPLTCIMGGTDYLKTVLVEASPAQRAAVREMDLDEIVEVIAGSSERLSGFLDDALRMTSIQAGHQRLDLRALPVAELLAPGLERAGLAAAVRHVVITDELSGTASWRVLGDMGSLQVTFSKLLDNAVSHNRDGGSVRVREVPNNPDRHGDAGQLATQPAFAAWGDTMLHWRTIEIHNTGEPIPADRMAALFGRFEVIGPIENHGRSSGLSLPIARGVVEQHGGHITVRSDAEHGTSFSIMLPTVPGNVTPRPAGSLWDDVPEGLGGRTGDEQVGQVADAALLEVELDDPGAPVPGQGHETGGRVDGAGGADHEEEITVLHDRL